jgi:GAF domain-containing protein
MAPWRRLIVAAVALTGLGAVAVVEQQAQGDADDRQDVLAAEAAVLVEGTGTTSVVAMAGGGGIVSPEGAVDLDSFMAYAREVVDASPLEALALEPVVPLETRAAFETSIGMPIQDVRDGELVPAGDRPVYFPVRAVVPATAVTRTVVGFDILADPVRGAAAVEARDSGRTILTEPVPATSSGTVSYFVVKPLYTPGRPTRTLGERRAAHAGFITTVYPGSSFTELLADHLPGDSRFTLRDGDERLAGTDARPRGGTTRSFDVGDRRWVLVVEDGRGVERSMVAAVAAFASLLLGGLLVYFRRSDLHDADVRRTTAVIASTADLAQALAAAATVEEVDEVIRRELPGVLGARGASLGLVDRDAGVLRVSSSPALDPLVTGRWSQIPLARPVPITEVVRTGEALVLRDPADWLAHGPAEVLADVEGVGLVSAVCLPLDDRHGQVAATLAISWTREVELDATTLATIRTITELCEYTLDRARTTDQAAEAAMQLARLAAKLASAVTVAEVLDIITGSASSPVGATATSVGLIDRDAGVLRAHHGTTVHDDVRERFADPPLDAPLAFTDAARSGEPVLLPDHGAFAERYPESAASTEALGFGARAAFPMRDSDGHVVGSIVYAWAGPRVFDETLISTLFTIGDIAAQALERTGLSEVEHRLVTNLQESLLVPLPPAAGLDIAARYRPSIADIGMGGDWYEGIVVDEHRYALIVGDVAGHGITAIGDMAQLRAVVGALVRLGIPLGEVFSHATTLLQASDRTPTASGLLLLIDTERDELAYVAAGHPPPLLREPDGRLVMLEDARQPILGIVVEERAAAVRPFTPGSVLVAYTDGLIERRGEPIDESLRRLHRHVASAPVGASPIADHLLARCLEGPDPADDVALVIVVREA